MLGFSCAAYQETGFIGNMKASPFPDKRETANFLMLNSHCFSLFEAQSPRKKSLALTRQFRQTEDVEAPLS